MDVVATPIQEQRTYQSRLMLLAALDDLAKLNAWIDNIQQDVGLPQDHRFGIELALTEAATNVITHAYPSDHGQQFEVGFEIRPDRIEVSIIDRGKAFDPTQATAAALPQSLDDAGNGGLGLHMIRGFTDECRYHREGDRNHFTMIFYLD